MNLLIRNILIVVFSLTATLLGGYGGEPKHPPIPSGAFVLAEINSKLVILEILGNDLLKQS